MFATSGHDVDQQHGMLDFVAGAERCNVERRRHVRNPNRPARRWPASTARGLAELAELWMLAVACRMRPLHIQLLIADTDREDVALLQRALAAAGHLVVDAAVTALPEGVAPGPDFVITDGAAQPTPESLEANEARHIAAVMRFAHGNRRQAAMLLGVARSTLLAKLRRFGMDRA
jgi:transcriptional regulator with AAA-type ATPase domain